MDLTASLFTARAEITYYNWKMCAAALNSDIPLALTAFRDALDHDAYWSEQTLRQDQDLTSLQGNPEFEQLVGISQIRRRELQERAKPELIVTSPGVNPSGQFPWVLALHGNSSNLRVANLLIPGSP